MGHLPRNKSPGHDGILNEHLLNGGDSKKQMLLILFNSVLQSAQVPDGWQTSISIPIFKGKGEDKTDPSTYRPFSLIPVVAKLFVKVVLNRITSYLKSNLVDFPNSQQQGFQPGLVA